MSLKVQKSPNSCFYKEHLKSEFRLGLGKDKDGFRDEIRIRLEVRRPSQELMIHVLGPRECRKMCVETG